MKNVANVFDRPQKGEGRILTDKDVLAVRF